MGDLFTYLRWRGDLRFFQSGFNEVDSLIFARLSYIPFEEMGVENFLRPRKLGEVARELLERPEAAEKVLMSQDLVLLKEVAESSRFSEVQVCVYCNLRDAEREMQFAAITFLLPREEGQRQVCIAFRGTDNTLIGWKEDFNMSFMEAVPAQKQAVLYLTQAAEQIAGPLILCGHSKGGNLAVYASAFCRKAIQQRICGVYNFDGPGFGETVLNQSGYQAVCSRIYTFVPQSSIIGMLLEHEEQYTIIHSTQTGLYQHDIYSWELERTSLCRLQAATNASRMVDRSLKEWISSMSPEEREKFFDGLFYILRQTNAQTLRELTENWYKNAVIMARSLKNMNEENRKLMIAVLRLLLRSARNNVFLLLPHRGGRRMEDKIETEGFAGTERTAAVGDLQGKMPEFDETLKGKS